MKVTIVALLTLVSSNILFSQDFYAAQRAGWLQKAEASKPKLIETIERPTRIVKIVADSTAFQKWKAVDAGPVDSLYTKSFKRQSGVVLDFGRHITGVCTISLKALRGVSDGPTRVKLTFGEVPSELATPFDPYPGALSRAWLQDETITIMDIPTTITIERRMSFRYLKIDLLGSSPYFDFTFSDIQCKATTSAAKPEQVLANGTPKEIEDIYNVGLATLQECMQTVYEDGPKRDRRLWTGDLYLESIANSYSFKNHELTKHCLYLLAGLANTDGTLYSNVFETPVPHAQVGAPFLFEYSLIYNMTVKEYVDATQDLETARDLWPVIARQMESPEKFLLDNGMFDNVAAANARWWLFVDWKENLDRQASIQGIIIYSMKQTVALAKKLGKEKDVAQLPGLIKKMTEAARKNLWDKTRGVVVSGPSKQISYASQAWMTLSGVLNQKEAQSAIRYAMAQPGTVRQGAPYLYHYFIEAMIMAGLETEAKEAVIDYWGGMVKKGADTFWEVYDPKDDFLSPYNFFPVNSYCHAWSCTPVYFIGKYPAIFQK